jgi:hypothetical protein
MTYTAENRASNETQTENELPSKPLKTPNERAEELYDLTQAEGNPDDDLMKLPASQFPHGEPWLQGVFEEKLRQWRQQEAEDRFEGNDWLLP